MAILGSLRPGIALIFSLIYFSVNGLPQAQTGYDQEVADASAAAAKHPLIRPAVLLAQPAATTDRTGWTVTADSFQAGYPPANVLDGNTNTFWHTEYSPVSAALPHTLTIDMKKQYYVNGVVYLARQDGNNNGNIGQHQVQLSLDGTTWTTPASGTFVDESLSKTAAFVTRPARYVRLIALTEAGGRGPWTSVSEINVLSAATYSAPPTNLGQWTNTIDFPIVPVAAVILHDTGDFLAWSSYTPWTFLNDNGQNSGTGLTDTTTYDPSSGIVTQRVVSNTQHDMFCPGLSMDANGRPLVTGGNSNAKTSIYDPNANNWIAGANMQITRGYQASATCSDGRIFMIGGSWSGGNGGKNGEIYDPTANTWTLLPGCPVAPMLTADAGGIFRQDNHGWLFGWKSGSVFQAGPSKAMNWYGTTGTGSQSGAGLRASDGDSMNGNAVMYDAVNGKILTVGGAPNYQNITATANAHIITIGNPGTTPNVQTINSMAFARSFANAVVLPDGKVFVTGGQSFPVPFSDDTAQFSPELWDPATSQFTTMNPMAIPRNYHSVGLLMPDATVLNGGGGLCGDGCAANHFDAESFSPPYLFNPDGSRATRPVINSISATSVVVGGTISVTMNTAVTSFSLIRGGSSTHTVDTDQRRIALTATASGLTYTMTVPNDPGVALPGYWMLFALTSGGVPSVAKAVLVKGQ